MGLLSKWFGPPTPERFARMIERTARGAGETRPCTFDTERFCLRFEGSGRNVLNLNNAYRDYCAAPRSERNPVLRRYAGLITMDRSEQVGEPTFEELRSQLLPRVRERFYFASFDVSQRAEQARSPTANDKPPLSGFLLRTLADALTLEVVIDLPDSIRSLSRSTVESWGMAFDEVLEAARENLWAISNNDFVLVRPGLFASPWRDTHDASRMALHDLIWQLPVNGKHVAAVPNRNVLLVTGDEDAGNLTAMAELARQVLTEPRPMTGTVFRLEGNQWHPFLPPAESPAHWPLRRVAMESTAREYSEQTELLHALQKAMGEDLFVPKQTLMRRADDTLYTWTSWVAGITDSLMPAADRVAFGSMQGGTPKRFGFAPWDRVCAVIGHRMEPTDLFPSRWRVRSFPSDAELAALELTEAPT